MTNRWMLGTIAVAMACMALGSEAQALQGSRGVDPTQIADRCIEQIQSMANRCIERNEDTADRCVAKIEDLRSIGLDQLADRLADACVRTINAQSNVCIRVIEAKCRACTRVLQFLGASDEAARVEAACENAISDVNLSRDDAIAMIRGDIVVSQ